jgi:hypothetical protein
LQNRQKKTETLKIPIKKIVTRLIRDY